MGGWVSGACDNREEVQVCEWLNDYDGGAIGGGRQGERAELVVMPEGCEGRGSSPQRCGGRPTAWWTLGLCCWR